MGDEAATASDQTAADAPTDPLEAGAPTEPLPADASAEPLPADASEEPLPADAPAEPLPADGLDPALSADGALEAQPGEGAGALSTALLDIVELLAVGGPVVGILLAMSVFALGIVIAKAWHLSTAKLGPERAAAAALELFRRADAPAALAQARQGRGPTARVLAATLEEALRGMPEDRLRETAWTAGASAASELRAWLRPLEVIAALAPLLGLFGTVLGMISAFAALEQGGSRVDPAVLSGGIWTALLTTAVGLAVAMPSVVAFNWFERRIEREEERIDIVMASFFSGAAVPRGVVRPDASSADGTRPDPTSTEASRYAPPGFAPAAAGE
ncbi:MAG: MotA/TolQ/ExbB proton channel family protein [Pseudomonadota bacterium]